MSTYTAIYTDILLANNAKVGQAVFNGNYMFSQNGINASGNAVSGTEYINFNSSDPYNESNSFRPTWCVNLKTGQQWMGNGTCTFRANGSGYVANGAIQWDQNGVVTHFPKTKVGVATISASSFYGPVSGSAATTVNATVTISDDYEDITSVIVKVWDPSEGFIAQADITSSATAGTETSISMKHSNDGYFKSGCVVKLYINDRLVAENSVAFIGIELIEPGGEVESYSITLVNDTASTSATAYLHNTATRTVSSTTLFLGMPVDRDGCVIVWNVEDGLTVNAQTGGTQVQLEVGSTVYVFMDNATSSSASFTLTAEN